MRRNSTRILRLSLRFLLAAVFSVAASFSAHFWLHEVFTPLATILILALTLWNWLTFKENYALLHQCWPVLLAYRRHALLRPAQYFLPGVGAFLFARSVFDCVYARQEISCTLARLAARSSCRCYSMAGQDMGPLLSIDPLACAIAAWLVAHCRSLLPGPMVDRGPLVSPSLRP